MSTKKLTGKRYSEIIAMDIDELGTVANWQLVQAFYMLGQVSRGYWEDADIMANTLVWDRLAGVLMIANNVKYPSPPPPCPECIYVDDYGCMHGDAIIDVQANRCDSFERTESAKD